MSRQARLYFLVPAAMLVLAIFPLPYGYYEFLRLVVAVAAAIAAYASYKTENSLNWVVVVMGLVALLFNPLVPVGLSRPLWLPIDLSAAALFAYVALGRGR